MFSVWHQSTVRAIREQMVPMLSNGSRGTLMSYTDHSMQCRLKLNAPISCCVRVLFCTWLVIFFLLAMCLCFCFVSAHGFVLVFCMPCALMSIVLTPPILFPDYWWICPTSLPSLPSSFAPFIISLYLQSCLALPCPAKPSLVASCLVFPLRGIFFLLLFCFYFLLNWLNKKSILCSTESSPHPLHSPNLDTRALSAAARDLFQDECLCLDTINIFTIFTLQKYRLHLFTFCRTDGRSVNVRLFRCIQMFCSGHVRSFHSFPCQRYTYIHIIHNSYTLKYNLIQSCKSELSSAVTLVFRVMWSFRNHSNILIYY